MPHERSPAQLRAIHEEFNKPADLIFEGLDGLDVVAEAQTALSNQKAPYTKLDRIWDVLDIIAKAPNYGRVLSDDFKEQPATVSDLEDSLVDAPTDKIEAIESLRKVLAWGLTDGGTIAYSNSHFKTTSENGTLYDVQYWKNRRSRIHRIRCYDDLADEYRWSEVPKDMEPDQIYTVAKKRKDLHITLRDKHDTDVELQPINILNLAGNIRIGLEG